MGKNKKSVSNKVRKTFNKKLLSLISFGNVQFCNKYQLKLLMHYKYNFTQVGEFSPTKAIFSITALIKPESRNRRCVEG